MQLNDLEWKLALRQEMSWQIWSSDASFGLLIRYQEATYNEVAKAGGRAKLSGSFEQIYSVADRMKRELVSLSYVPTEDNVADMLTKRLGFQKVKHLCDLIGLALVVNDEPSQAG